MFQTKKQMTESIEDATRLNFAKLMDKCGNIERGVIRIEDKLERLDAGIQALTGALTLISDVTTVVLKTEKAILLEIRKAGGRSEIGKKGSRWTELEDKLLIEQASKLSTWRERASVFPERTPKACERRYALLCKKK